MEETAHAAVLQLQVCLQRHRLAAQLAKVLRIADRIDIGLSRRKT
jgi:hypothetical protein